MGSFFTEQKTYILSAIAGLVSVTYFLQWITGEQWAIAMGMLGFGTQVTQRIATANLKHSLEAQVAQVETAVVVQAVVVDEVKNVEAKVEAIPAVNMPHR